MKRIYDTTTFSIRFDPELHQRASIICSDLGYELNDVIRIFIARIVRDNCIPFDLEALPTINEDKIPFYQFEERLWGNSLNILKAELSITLISRFVAMNAGRISEEESNSHPDIKKIQQLKEEISLASHKKNHLDVNDSKQIQSIIDFYKPLLNSGTP